MVKENEDDQKCYMCTMWQKGKSLDLFKNFLNFRNSYDFINQGNSSHLTKYKNVIGFFFHRSKSIIVGSFKIKMFVCIFKEIQFPFFGDQEALKLQSNVKCCPRAKWRNCKVVHRPSKHCFYSTIRHLYHCFITIALGVKLHLWCLDSFTRQETRRQDTHPWDHCILPGQPFILHLLTMTFAALSDKAIKNVMYLTFIKDKIKTIKTGILNQVSHDSSNCVKSFVWKIW